MENDQKPRWSSCIVIESDNVKIMLFLLRGYHMQQLENIAIPDIAFVTPQFQNFTNLPYGIFWG